MKPKKIALTKLISSIVILSLAAFWIYEADRPFGPIAYALVAIMILFAGFGLYTAIVALNNAKAGLSSEDELSKRMSDKAAAKAFRFSFFMWFLIELFLFDVVDIENEVQAKMVVGLGLLGMGLIFLLARLYFSKFGILDENQD